MEVEEMEDAGPSSKNQLPGLCLLQVCGVRIWFQLLIQNLLQQQNSLGSVSPGCPALLSFMAPAASGYCLFDHNLVFLFGRWSAAATGSAELGPEPVCGSKLCGQTDRRTPVSLPAGPAELQTGPSGADVSFWFLRFCFLQL